MIGSGVIMGLQERVSIGGDSERPSQEFKEFVEGEWGGTAAFDSAITYRLGSLNPDQKFVLGDFFMDADAKSSGRVGRPAMLFAIGKNSKNPQLAAKVIEFMLASEEGAKILRATRGAFLSKTGNKTLVDMDLIPPLNQDAIEQIRNTQCHTPNPYFEHARIKDVMRTAFESVGYGKMSLDDAADLLTNDGNRALRRLAR